ncbi:hypothetical protein L208DRAFT_1378507 [Tricholoma matsutake]|nr:hypothetical protein L208DRAFT_1378507 [Tricholoma matsutake 945]
MTGSTLVKPELIQLVRDSIMGGNTELKPLLAALLGGHEHIYSLVWNVKDDGQGDFGPSRLLLSATIYIDISKSSVSIHDPNIFLHPWVKDDPDTGQFIREGRSTPVPHIIQSPYVPLQVPYTHLQDRHIPLPAPSHAALALHSFQEPSNYQDANHATLLPPPTILTTGHCAQCDPVTKRQCAPSVGSPSVGSQSCARSKCAVKSQEYVTSGDDEDMDNEKGHGLVGSAVLQAQGHKSGPEKALRRVKKDEAKLVDSDLNMTRSHLPTPLLRGPENNL